LEKKNLMLSRRGESIPLSPIRKLTPYADEAKRNGVRILHLNIGQPDIRTPDPILRAYREFQEPVIAYGPSLGLPRLRESISGYYRRYGLSVDPDDVAVTIGGSEATRGWPSSLRR
jgi:aspartate aminotransferase